MCLAHAFFNTVSWVALHDLNVPAVFWFTVFLMQEQHADICVKESISY